MSQHLEVDSSKAAVGVATALLDCVIAGPEYKADFRLNEITDDPELEPFIEVAAFDWTGVKKFSIRVDSDSGEIIERKVHD